MTDEYQPRTADRLVEILKSESTGPRSWQAEAADEMERLQQQIYDSIPKWQANDLQAEIDRLRATAMQIVRDE